jgi:hypothetical protein
MNDINVNQSSPFDYAKIEMPEDCIFKISPSSISKFFEYPVVWYKDQVLGETQFQGNTSSVLGSIVHGLAEMYVKGQETSSEMVEAYLRRQLLKPDVNIQEVRELYPDMAAALINEYIRYNKPTEVERSLCYEVKDGVYVAGTFDNITETGKYTCMVVDYKNVGTKPNTNKIPWGYYVQEMAYAYMLKKEHERIQSMTEEECEQEYLLEYEEVETSYKDKLLEKNPLPDKIRLVYVVRPTKTLPIRVFKVTQIINDDDYQNIEDVLNLIADTVLLGKERPELNYLLYKSMQLKDQP